MSFSRTDACEISGLISIGTSSIIERDDAIKLRKKALRSAVVDSLPMVKNAFDTRHIDSEDTFNPRRGLQHYHRAEPFVSEKTADTLKNLLKLHGVLEEIKAEYGKDFEWLDSNARILLNTLNTGLRIKQGDGNFSESQPSQGGLNYIEELLYVRYRLGYDELSNLTKEALKKVILSKDELLSKNAIYKSESFSNIVPQIVKNNEVVNEPVRLVSESVQAVRTNDSQVIQTQGKTSDGKTVTININLGS
jgi:hypothetical protein